MEAVQITFAAALLIGFSYGAGPCNIACLPYLGPIFLSRESERLGRWGTILPFSAGRIFSYALLGTAAGLIAPSPKWSPA
ncbi:sulfite exporter TauE/SafE family protein [Candidatus Reidiella endopervernicosa]|uniref:Sulfite exporter TauE/SafE family protein n=1 Tax=Candidatus Reidiella endopervernicosa TaxID=2738883 RepID=A0A6N0HU81_9GAMM|nr:sulfite exporter TauE/SafE family protein [Candidatus Reidiella endopervernicosa]QKQ25757.1 sulfite exporter TauE/SafE family protein [Candidatus Reidiella endopervernicosa]